MIVSEDKFVGRRHLAEYQSPLGKIVLAADEEALLGLWFEGQKYFLDTLKNVTIWSGTNEILWRAREWLDAYFAKERPGIFVPEAVLGAVRAQDTPGQKLERPDRVVAFLEGGLPLAPIGTPFQRQVWRLLCQIPYGETTTYKALAEKAAVILGRDHMSVRAVGGAVGHNRISLMIPCHRVVGSSGSLTGYAGGLDKKQRLLEMEELQ